MEKPLESPLDSKGINPQPHTCCCESFNFHGNVFLRTSYKSLKLRVQHGVQPGNPQDTQSLSVFCIQSTFHEFSLDKPVNQKQTSTMQLHMKSIQDHAPSSKIRKQIPQVSLMMPLILKQRKRKITHQRYIRSKGSGK